MPSTSWNAGNVLEVQYNGLPLSGAQGKTWGSKIRPSFNVQLARDVFDVFGVTIPIGSLSTFFLNLHSLFI